MTFWWCWWGVVLVFLIASASFVVIPRLRVKALPPPHRPQIEATWELVTATADLEVWEEEIHAEEISNFNARLRRLPGFKSTEEEEKEEEEEKWLAHTRAVAIDHASEAKGRVEKERVLQERFSKAAVPLMCGAYPGLSDRKEFIDNDYAELISSHSGHLFRCPQCKTDLSDGHNAFHKRQLKCPSCSLGFEFQGAGLTVWNFKPELVAKLRRVDIHRDHNRMMKMKARRQHQIWEDQAEGLA